MIGSEKYKKMLNQGKELMMSIEKELMTKGELK